MSPRMVEEAMAREEPIQKLPVDQSVSLTILKEAQPTTIKQTHGITSTITFRAVSPTIMQEPIEPESKEVMKLFPSVVPVQLIDLTSMGG